MIGMRLEEWLIQNGAVTSLQVQRAVRESERSGHPISQVLTTTVLMSERELLEMQASYFGVGFFDPNSTPYQTELLESVPSHIMRQHRVFPVALQDDCLTVAMADPRNVLALDDIRLVTGYRIEPVLAAERAIEELMQRHFSRELAIKSDIDNQLEEMLTGPLTEVLDEEPALDKLESMIDQAPVVRLVQMIISTAIKEKASDIHIEPDAKSLRVRYRVDGMLHEVMTPPSNVHPLVVSRIKIMASLDIAERRCPQDGKIHLRHDSHDYDLRVSTIPTVHGEKVVMRILDRSSVMLGLDRLGMVPRVRDEVHGFISRPHGMFLVTGPTGSGKSTTLYGCLNHLNTGVVNINTVEDPVEYQIPGINQVQVNEKAGVTFASMLRAFLRQDPNIIMVGEVRDCETAHIAIESALTGHLVLSTLHTNDAAGAVTRLVDMGVEPFLCASSIVGVMAQRLARRICPNCIAAEVASPEVVRTYGLSAYTDHQEIVLYRGAGCAHCGMTGYRGRTGIHECLAISDRIRGLILQRASSAEIRQAAIEEGMRTMQDDGMLKVLSGEISLDECLRVVSVETLL